MAARIGDFMRELRTTRRLSLSQLAERSRVARRTLCYWEANAHAPSMTELEAIFTALGASAPERLQALTLINAPRAVHQLRSQSTSKPLQDIGPMPSGGDLLRALRRRRGLAVEQAADVVGVSAPTISRWETGKVIPDAERLNALLSLFGVSEIEKNALQDGYLFLTAPLQESAISRHALRESFEKFAMEYYAYREDKLNDLRFLSFEAQAWRMAAREPDGPDLLASIRAAYAEYLSGFRRFREASRYAHSAHDLQAKKARMQPSLMGALIISANTAVYGGAQLHPNRGLELLGSCQMSSWPAEFHAWGLSDMATYLALDNNQEAARRLFQDACRVAARASNPDELGLRKLDLARFEVRTGHAERGLSLVSFDPQATPFRRADVELLFAEGMLGMKDSAGAQTWLERANSDIVTHDLQHLRSRAEAAARQL